MPHNVHRYYKRPKNIIGETSERQEWSTYFAEADVCWWKQRDNRIDYFESFQSPVNCEENWIYSYGPDSNEEISDWKHTNSSRTKDKGQNRADRNLIMITFFDSNCIIYNHNVPKDQSLNKSATWMYWWTSESPFYANARNVKTGARTHHTTTIDTADQPTWTRLSHTLPTDQIFPSTTSECSQNWRSISRLNILKRWIGAGDPGRINFIWPQESF